MAIKQISVYMENKPSKLAEFVKQLAEAEINIRAMSLADTADFGVLRLILSDPEKAEKIFGEKMIISTTRVIAAEMDDKRGALSNVLSILQENNVNLEYMYAFTGKQPLSAYVVLRVEDVDAVEAMLEKAGINTLNDDSLCI